MARRIKMIVAYDGKKFSGWQVQREERTVQGVIEAALESMEKQTVRVTAAGRTDSGVHARGQVVHFDTTLSSIEADRFAPALNAILPADVRIVGSSAVPDDFHARYSAKARSYRYFLYPGVCVSPFLRPYCYAPRSLPSIGSLNRAVSPLLGSHDFSSLSAAGDPSPSKVRVIYQAVFLQHRGMIEFRITGNAFLWRMVRSIVGTALEVASAEDPARAMRLILDEKDRSLAGTTAPARGLFFWRVHYTMEQLYG
ncbi:tRNA pseudouridine(38-40) synthase TruA [Sediminispirochaeta bajacaliforniensis]|uniref:tRNA pseudouridine(38-40) synthase TruA n=1 Tax=Sediminispirochaeta bajacaliforniensis TaxID=148 RepID=UPI000475D81A|nr:tRNA pseudouridine(38-40) synthase TruA [Sediminispirochaeta bajacaliforniensis]